MAQIEWLTPLARQVLPGSAFDQSWVGSPLRLVSVPDAVASSNFCHHFGNCSGGNGTAGGEFAAHESKRVFEAQSIGWRILATQLFACEWRGFNLGQVRAIRQPLTHRQLAIPGDAPKQLRALYGSPLPTMDNRTNLDLPDTACRVSDARWFGAPDEPRHPGSHPRQLQTAHACHSPAAPRNEVAGSRCVLVACPARQTPLGWRLRLRPQDRCHPG